MLERYLQILATSCFAIMTIINLLQYNWKFMGVNLALTMLYIFLYFVK